MVFAAISLGLFFAFTAAAQDDPPDAAPPPIKVIPKEDAVRLATKTDVKDRTKISLELMNQCLAAAERLSTERNFPAMYEEFGHFHALMDDALNYLTVRDTGRGKVLDNFKRLEISLRAMATRIEIIRRELPLRYDPYVRKLMGYLRNVRAKATDSLFGDSVVPVKKPGEPQL